MEDKPEHEKFMRIAIRLSEENVDKARGGPFGAVIVKDGKIIAKSANKVTSSNDPTAHAEVSAIRIASRKLNTYDLSGCVIYSSCEPCPMCLGAIYWAKISAVYYGNTKHDAAGIGFDDHFIYEELALPLEKRNCKFTRILKEESILAFKKWQNSELKISY